MSYINQIETILRPPGVMDAESTFPYGRMTADARELYDRVIEDSRDLWVLYEGFLLSGDIGTMRHQTGTGRITAELVSREPNLGAELQELAVLMSVLHDIGKDIVPLEVINKPGPLNESELRIMQLHSHMGYLMIKDYVPLEASAGLYLHHLFQRNPYPSDDEARFMIGREKLSRIQHIAMQIASLIALPDHAEAQHPFSPRNYMQDRKVDTVSDLTPIVMKSIAPYYEEHGFGSVLIGRMQTVQDFADRATQ